MHSTIKDNDAALLIDKASRRIIVPDACRVIGAVGDHQSEQLTFQAPRYIDGHDVAGCALIQVAWSGRHRGGSDFIAARSVTADHVRFVWTVPGRATMEPGPLWLAVSFRDTDATGGVVYSWSTEICRELRIAERLQTSADADVSRTENTDDGLLQIDVNEPKLNAEVYAAVRGVLYG